ncbi:hypothetical protein ABPG72_018881 [Tetrahymena utriculariae]
MELSNACYNWIRSEWDDGRLVTSDQIIGFFADEKRSLQNRKYKYLIQIPKRQMNIKHKIQKKYKKGESVQYFDTKHTLKKSKEKQIQQHRYKQQLLTLLEKNKEIKGPNISLRTVNMGFQFRQKFDLSLRIPLKKVLYDSDSDLDNQEEGFHYKIVLVFDTFTKFYPEEIYNMDQVALYYENMPQRVIAQKGAINIRVESKNQEKQRITFILIICRDGKKLPTFLIYKRENNGIIHKEVKKSNEKDICYTVQKNAWAIKKVLQEWIEYFKQQIDQDKPFILLADSYGLHLSMLPQLISKEKSQHVIFIPPCMTPKLQSLDVGINNCLKEQRKIMWYGQQDISKMAESNS